METIPKVTDQGIPINRNPNTFPSFGNVGPPLMAMLSLPVFMIGLLVWVFSTYLIPNT